MEPQEGAWDPERIAVFNYAIFAINLCRGGYEVLYGLIPNDGELGGEEAKVVVL